MINTYNIGFAYFRLKTSKAYENDHSFIIACYVNLSESFTNDCLYKTLLFYLQHYCVDCMQVMYKPHSSRNLSFPSPR